MQVLSSITKAKNAMEICYCLRAPLGPGSNKLKLNVNHVKHSLTSRHILTHCMAGWLAGWLAGCLEL